MFSSHYNHILSFDEHKAAEFNVHFLPHTPKWVLLPASWQAEWADLSLRVPLFTQCGHKAQPSALFFLYESSTTTFLDTTLSGPRIKLVKRERRWTSGPFPSLSQATLQDKEQRGSVPILLGKMYFRILSLPGWQGWAEIQILIWRESFGEAMGETVPQMLAVISTCKTLK